MKGTLKCIANVGKTCPYLAHLSKAVQLYFTDLYLLCNNGADLKQHQYVGALPLKLNSFPPDFQVGDIQIGACFGGLVIEGNCDWVPEPCQDSSVCTEINTTLSLHGDGTAESSECLYGQRRGCRNRKIRHICVLKVHYE